jgi:hypothetical protein
MNKSIRSRYNEKNAVALAVNVIYFIQFAKKLLFLKKLIVKMVIQA